MWQGEQDAQKPWIMMVFASSSTPSSLNQEFYDVLGLITLELNHLAHFVIVDGLLG